MIGKPQFSLGYLFLETFWIALAIGLTRHLMIMSRHELFPDEAVVVAICFVTDIFAIPIAIGGLLERMRAGAICGLIALLVFCCYSFPTVQ
jgi:hypothetical protein